jgi:hypothetical protein
MAGDNVDLEEKEEPLSAPVDQTLPTRPWRLHPTPWPRIVSHPYKGSGTDSDPFIVTYVDDDDENPMRYTTVYKWTITVVGE